MSCKSSVYAALLVLCVCRSSSAQLVVGGSPEYDEAAETGAEYADVKALPGWAVNNSGVAVGYAGVSVAGASLGERAVRWDATGAPAEELGHLGTSGSGSTFSTAFAINDSGVVVGSALKYVGTSNRGDRAVRWDAGGTVATELGNLGTSGTGLTSSQAFAVNSSGLAVGYARKYVGTASRGNRAVRWDAGGTAATELGDLGTSGTGSSDAGAYAVNDSGVAVGYADKYVGGVNLGDRAVRWDAGDTVAVELGNLGTSGTGATFSQAYAVNSAGVVVGYADKFVDGSNLGNRAVRWDAGGTAAVELDNLGTDGTGYSFSYASAVNSTGAVVGLAEKYVGGVSLGNRAVRWNAGGVAVTELGNLGTDGDGFTSALAYAVNGAGSAVGFAAKYVGGVNQGNRAVFWLPDASAVDLNDLGLMPASGGGVWTLEQAFALSADGWVSGIGGFDPDGAGALQSYDRAWVAQVGLGGSWTNAAGGTWGRGPNWSTGTPAMQVGAATFDLDGDYAVAFDRNERTEQVSITDGFVRFNLAGNTLTVENGLSIAVGAGLGGTGVIVADVTNAGTIGPGNSPGVLEIDGDLANTGALVFEIAGTSLNEFDRLLVSGEFDAGGTIEVVLDGYQPEAGDSFTLMTFADFVDSGLDFDFSQALLAAGLGWDSSQFSTTGVLSVAAVPEPSALSLLCLFPFAYLLRRRLRRAPLS